MTASARMKKLRAVRRGIQCRQCKMPVALSKSGVPFSSCRTHLDEDAKRKKKK